MEIKYSYLYIFLIHFAFTVLCNPPTRSGVITDFTFSKNTVDPGDSVTLTWKFSNSPDVKTIGIYLGHSTGMGHAPTKLLASNVDPSKEISIITIPKVAASSPGNIWIIEIMWNNGGEQTDLATGDIEIE